MMDNLPTTYQDCKTRREKEAWMDNFHRQVLYAWYKDKLVVNKLCRNMPPDVAVKRTFENEVQSAYTDFNYHVDHINSLEDLWRS